MRKTRPSRYTRYGTRLTLIPIETLTYEEHRVPSSSSSSSSSAVVDMSSVDDTTTTTVVNPMADFPNGIPLGILWDREFFRTPKQGARCPYFFSSRCVNQREAELMTEGRDAHPKSTLVTADYAKELLGLDVEAYAIAVVQPEDNTKNHRMSMWNRLLGRRPERRITFAWYVRLGAGFPMGVYALRVEHLHFRWFARGRLVVDAVWQGGELRVDTENRLMDIVGAMGREPTYDGGADGDDQQAVEDAGRPAAAAVPFRERWMAPVRTLWSQGNAAVASAAAAAAAAAAASAGAGKVDPSSLSLSPSVPWFEVPEDTFTFKDDDKEVGLAAEADQRRPARASELVDEADQQYDDSDDEEETTRSWLPMPSYRRREGPPL